MQRACLATAVAVVALGTAVGCGSGGSAAKGSPTAPVPGTTTASVSPSPVSMPVDTSPTPVRRTVRRPAGARPVDFTTCITPSNVVSLYLRDQVFGTGDRAVQEQQLGDIGGLLDPQLAKTRQARHTWLTDGYPANFPVVRDLDGFIATYVRLQRAAGTKDVGAVPDLYIELNTVIAQYGADTRGGVCG